MPDNTQRIGENLAERYLLSALRYSRSLAKLVMRSILPLISLASFAVHATGPQQSERAAILNAARPAAAALAHQPVRLKIDRLNIDSGWAVIYGELVPAANRKALDWNLAEGCYLDLDKSLWVVLQKKSSRTGWQVRHIEICASEPPYWYPEQYGGLIWPCGVYAGFDDGGEETLETRCRNQNATAE